MTTSKKITINLSMSSNKIIRFFGGKLGIKFKGSRRDEPLSRRFMWTGSTVFIVSAAAWGTYATIHNERIKEQFRLIYV